MIRLRGELRVWEKRSSLDKRSRRSGKHYNFLTTQIQDLEKALEDLKILIKELKDKINSEFLNAFHSINDKFNHFFKLMFKGGNAKMKIRKQEIKVKINEKEEDAVASEDENEEQEEKIGIEIELDLPKKRITSLEMLSGGEKSLVSIAALFALVSVSPPPFLV